MKPLALIKDGESYKFESYAAAARWLSQKIGKTFDSARDKFKKHRAHVFGYDVEYL